MIIVLFQFEMGFCRRRKTEKVLWTLVSTAVSCVLGVWVEGHARGHGHTVGGGGPPRLPRC